MFNNIVFTFQKNATFKKNILYFEPSYKKDESWFFFF